MAFFRCSGGTDPTGNATAADVKEGKTFSNANGTGLTGTFAAQEKTVTSSRSAQTVTPDSGKYLSKVTVNALAPTGTYTANSRGAALDMGATSNYRYVNTNSVPNTNSGTYTYAANSTGGTIDMGATNTYRYVNAANVYAKGKSDGAAGVTATIKCTWTNNGDGNDIKDPTVYINGSAILLQSGWTSNNRTTSKSFTIGGVSASGYLEWSGNGGDEDISEPNFVLTIGSTTRKVLLNRRWSSAHTTGTTTIRILNGSMIDIASDIP